MKKIIVLIFIQFFAIKQYGQDSLIFFLPEVEWQIIDSSSLDEDIPTNSMDFIIFSQENSAYYLCRSGFNIMNSDSTISLAIESVCVYVIKQKAISRRKVLKLIWDESVFKKPKKIINVRIFNISESLIVINDKKYYRFPEHKVYFNRPSKILQIKS